MFLYVLFFLLLCLSFFFTQSGNVLIFSNCCQLYILEGQQNLIFKNTLLHPNFILQAYLIYTPNFNTCPTFLINAF
jgi:hypothetical protein